jgi:GntR family transcriptional regulator
MSVKKYQDIQSIRAAMRASRSIPMKQVIIEDVTGQIERGVLRPGDRLPSTAELCRQYGVSSIVVANAMQWLKAKDLVVGVAGVGVFVAEKVARSR